MIASPRPCPFCGTEIVAMQNTRKHYWVDCQVVGCDIGGPVRESEEEAWKAWNTRPIEDRLAARSAARELDRLELVRLRVQHEIDATALAEIRRIVTQALAGHGNDTAAWVEVQRVLDAIKEVE